MISVALPVYNGSRYIEQSLKSLIAQGSDIEIVVSDDASTDNTVEIVEGLSAPNIVLIRNKKNGGQFVNLNKAVKECTGDFIQIFSHDDIAHEGFLVSQQKAFDPDERIGLVYSNNNSIDEHGFRIGGIEEDGTPEIINHDAYLQISARYGSLPPSISSVMVKRHVFDEVGFFDEDFIIAGDLEFYNRVAECFLLARNCTILLDIRDHSESCTRNSVSPFLYAKEEAEIIKYYKKHLSAESFSEIMKVREKNRGASHAKSILRAIASGRIVYALKYWRELSKVHSVPNCMFHAVRQKISSVNSL